MWEELRSFPPRDLDRHDAVYRRWALRGMADGTVHALLVEDADGRVLGSGALWKMPIPPRPGVLGRGRVPYILSMYTDPRARGHGVATRIVNEMVRWAQARGYGRLLLHASKYGRPVYEKLGFEAGSEMRLELIAQPPSPR
jgi:GNAT superfamily N-acetyltransferase